VKKLVRQHPVFVLLGLCALGILASYCIWSMLAREYPDLSVRYQAGSVLGAIGSSFGVLAFAGLVFTLLLQQQVLERLDQQAFETLLVQLIGFHHHIIGAVHLKLREAFEGRAAIRQLGEILDATMDQGRRPDEQLGELEHVRMRYEQFYGTHGAHLAHYFRNLYHIIKYIDQSGVSDMRRYASLVRAQLSPSELDLLFYAGLSKEGTKFKALIEKYALLEQLPNNKPGIGTRRELYAASAFGHADS
jgi:hypothetical protein